MIASRCQFAAGLFFSLSLVAAIGCDSTEARSTDNQASSKAVLFHVTGQRPVEGSGILMLEQRRVRAPFVAIDAGQGITLSVREAHGKPAIVAVGADSNLLPLIETEVRNRVLQVRINGSVQSDYPLWVDVTADGIETI